MIPEMPLRKNLLYFLPKSITCIASGYTVHTFMKDLFAACMVSIVSIPGSLAFAIGAGLSPEKGLICAIVGSFIAGLFSGSNVIVSGPTSAFIVLIFSLINTYSFESVQLAIFLAGCILIIFGITRSGTLIRFIPYPVKAALSFGIAIVLTTIQMKDVLGLSIEHPSAEFVARIHQYMSALNTINPYALCISSFTFLIIYFLRGFSNRLPHMMIALLCSSIITSFFSLPISTIQTTYGSLITTFPSLSFPTISIDGIQNILDDALAISILVAIETLISASYADGITGFKHKPNCELISQGCANIASALFTGLPTSGGLVRTHTNAQMGAKTPIAACLHACILFFFLEYLGSFAGNIPLSAISACLIWTAINMLPKESIIELFKGHRGDKLTFITTTAVSIFIDITIAVQVGVLISAYSFLKVMSHRTTLTVHSKIQKETAANDLSLTYIPVQYYRNLPKEIEIFELDGPFFFGVADILNHAFINRPSSLKIFILSMRRVPFIDASGIYAIRLLKQKCLHHDIIFLLAEPQKEVHHILKKTELYKFIGKEYISPTLEEAVHFSKRLLTAGLVSRRQYNATSV